MLNEIPNEQFARYFDGSASPEEKREIIRWHKKSAENKRLFNELYEIWTLTGKFPEDFRPDASIAWKNVSNRIDEYEKTKQNNSRNVIWYLSKIAAVFVIGFVLYFSYQWKYASNISFENFATTETKEKLLLPDGSTVWLNAHSVLQYVKNFEGEIRLLKLNGEAFFEVTRNPKKPFVVESVNSSVKVLGTSFNYKAYDLDEENILIVNTGRVEFSDIDNTKKSILEKGEKVEYSVANKFIKKSVNNNKNFLSWKTGVLVFENETFENIINEISGFYNQTFTITNPTLKSIRLTVTFDNQNLQNVLKVIELTMNCSFKETSDKIFIN